MSPIIRLSLEARVQDAVPDVGVAAGQEFQHAMVAARQARNRVGSPGILRGGETHETQRAVREQHAEVNRRRMPAQEEGRQGIDPATRTPPAGPHAAEDGHPVPGETTHAPDPVVLNAGRPALTLDVVNMGDRPVQVGSHYPFFESNAALRFDRAAALGFRLDIPSGTAVRFEPGERKTVRLVRLGGARRVFGGSGLVSGDTSGENARAAVRRAEAEGFLSTTPAPEPRA